jgi:general secretion pathway protein J
MNLDRPRAPAAGFTLLELLVAVSVLSIVSLIAWRGLESLVHTRERLKPEAEGVRELLVAFGQIERDLAQAVSTAVVPLQTAPVRVRRGTPAGFEMIRFAPVTAGSPSAVQVVVYELRQGRLVRLSSAPMTSLDAPPGAELVETPLLADVQALQVRLWQPGRGWTPPEAAAPVNPRAAPPGLELIVERSDGRQYRRVLLVGTG